MRELYNIFLIVTMVLAIGTLVYTYVDIFLTRRNEKRKANPATATNADEPIEEQSEEQTDEQPEEQSPTEEATEDVK